MEVFGLERVKGRRLGWAQYLMLVAYICYDISTDLRLYDCGTKRILIIDWAFVSISSCFCVSFACI